MAFNQKRYTQLRKCPKRWVSHGLDGAAELLDAVDAAASPDARLRLLEERDANRPGKREFRPGSGHSVGSRTALVTLQEKVIRKG